MNQLTLLVLFLVSPVLCQAQESEPPNPPHWSYSISLSYLGASGNTRALTLGTEFVLKRLPTPWGLEGSFGYTRSDRDNQKSSERFQSNIKVSRSLKNTWDLFFSNKLELDRFAGFDLRLTFALGISYKWINIPRQTFQVDFGATIGLDAPLTTGIETYMGSLLQLRYTFNWSKTSALNQTLTFIPNFASSTKWRTESETSATAALSHSLNLKGSFVLRYSHQPPQGFNKTDTVSALSIVYSF